MELNRPLGVALKQDGMQRALQFSGSAWTAEILEELKTWLAKQKKLGLRTVTIEAFRAQCSNPPASHQAWGSVPGIAVKAGLIAPHYVAPGQQGRVKAAAPRTHAHEVKLWEVL